jgi:hypothetical protein
MLPGQRHIAPDRHHGRSGQREPTGRTFRFGELAADAASITLDKEPALKRPDQYSFIVATLRWASTSESRRPRAAIDVGCPPHNPDRLLINLNAVLRAEQSNGPAHCRNRMHVELHRRHAFLEKSGVVEGDSNMTH